MVAAPILFAGVIFAVSFDKSAAPERAFGANIAGAMLGGLAEYSFDAARLPVPRIGGAGAVWAFGPLREAGPAQEQRGLKR